MEGQAFQRARSVARCDIFSGRVLHTIVLSACTSIECGAIELRGLLAVEHVHASEELSIRLFERVPPAEIDLAVGPIAARVPA